MTDDLVTRLRDQWEATPPDICHAAADRIEALEAALHKIIKNDCCIGCTDEARAALGEEKDD